MLIELAGLFLLQFGILYYIVEQFATAGVLHYQVELFRSFYDLVELNDIGVSYLLENVDFSRNSFDIRRICYAILFEDLDADLLPSQGMSSKLDLSESAFAN